MSLSNAGGKIGPYDFDEEIKSRDGTKFNPAADNWCFSTNSGTKYFDLARIELLCAPDLALAVRKTLTWYLEYRSEAHASNLNNRLHHFLGEMSQEMVGKVDVVTERMVVNYRANLDSTNEWYLGCLRSFFLRLTALGYPGVDRSAVRLLEEITIKGNKKGWAVLTMDEDEGPFTDKEFRMIRGAVRKAFSEQRLTLRQTSLSNLYMSLGLRSSQVADLKVKDLEVKKGMDGNMEYLLHVPRVKQRYVKRREQTKERELDVSVGEVLAAWCRQVTEDFGGKVRDCRELPIFPSIRKKVELPEEFFLHTDSNNLRSEIVRIFKKLAIVSPVTGKVMKVIPMRFRYTLGTRAVRYGAGAEVVAELLDHLDMQNVTVYTQLSEELIEALSEQLSDDLEPLAQAFRGEIVLFGQGDLSDPSRLISYPGVDPAKGYAGKCRCGGECDNVPPVFCYPCENFTAFKGAPHEEALEHMLAEQAKERDLGNEEVARQIQEAIDACRVVVRKCQEES